MPRHRTAWICGGLLFGVFASSAAHATEPLRDTDGEAPAAPPAAPPPKDDQSPRAGVAADAALAVGIPKDAPLLSDDHWEFSTSGRIGTFFSWAKGDGMPQATTYDIETGTPLHQVLTNTGGSGPVPQESHPVLKADGTPSAQLVSSIDSMRIRSGFTGNIIAFSARRRVGDSTVTGYISVTSIVDSQSQKKYFQNLPDVREGYFRVEGGWGTFLAGRSGVLFNRGAVESDFLYLHGYGVGLPADLHSSSAFPTAGQIGYGVLANGFGAGFVYSTPNVAGLKLSVGLYDPASLTGSSIERTKFLRPEFELVANERIGNVAKLHFYCNGGFQPNYQQDKTDDVVKYLYGVGYGARVEVGPVHVAGGGHWGRGLGLAYPGLPSDAVYDNESTLRFTDGFYGILQVALGQFDLNGGFGRTLIHMTTFDRTAVVNPTTMMLGDPQFSVIQSQTAYSGAVVLHAQRWLHFDVDYMFADSKWDLGERQKISYLNAGTTVTW